MKEVALMLGVNFDEEFEINGTTGKFKITESGLVYEDNTLQPFTLINLLKGKYNKLPWKPGCGKEYYFYSLINQTIKNKLWVKSELDFWFYKIGNCYRTKEEAEAHIDEWKVLCERKEPINILEKNV